MKKILVVGLMLGCTELSFGWWGQKTVSQFGKNLAISVNKSFDKACDMFPSVLDRMADAFNNVDREKFPTLTDIANEKIGYEYGRNDSKAIVINTEHGAHTLSVNAYIDAMNEARPMIDEAYKNKKPLPSPYISPATVVIGVGMYNAESKDAKNLSAQNEVLALQAHKNAEAQKLAAWQSNPDKISDETAAALLICKQSMINNNFKINRTYHNWFMTWGWHGKRVMRSTVAIGAGIIAIYCDPRGDSNLDKETMQAVLQRPTFLGGVLIALGACGYLRARGVDHVKFDHK